MVTDILNKGLKIYGIITIAIPIILVGAFVIMTVMDMKREDKKQEEMTESASKYAVEYALETYGETRKYSSITFEEDASTGGMPFVADATYESFSFDYIAYRVTCYPKDGRDPETTFTCKDDMPDVNLVNASKAFALKKYGVSYKMHDTFNLELPFGNLQRRLMTAFNYNNNMVYCYNDDYKCTDVLPDTLDQKSYDMALKNISNKYPDMENIVLKSYVNAILNGVPLTQYKFSCTYLNRTSQDVIYAFCNYKENTCKISNFENSAYGLVAKEYIALTN